MNPLSANSTAASSAEEFQTVAAVVAGFAHLEGPALATAIDLLRSLLLNRPHWPAAQHVALARLIAYLDERREAAELAADPARRAALEQAGRQLGRKAQSGFAGEKAA